jgi:hypothetical protein
MLAVGSGAMTAAHFAGASAMGVVAFEHSTYASKIVVVAFEGAASVLASTTNSFVGVGRTG